MPKRKAKPTQEGKTEEESKPKTAKKPATETADAPKKKPSLKRTKKQKATPKEKAVDSVSEVAVVAKVSAQPEQKSLATELSDVRKQEEFITESKENQSSGIDKLLEILNKKHDSSDDVVQVLGASQSLRRVFNKLAESGDLVCRKSEEDTEQQIALRKQFRDYHLFLLGLLCSGDVRLQASSLHALMDSIKLDWLEESKAGRTHDLGLCKQVMLALVTASSLPEAVLTDLRDKFLSPYADLRNIALKSLKVLVATTWPELEKQARGLMPAGWEWPECTRDKYVNNLVELLLSLPQESPAVEQLWGGKAAVAKDTKEGKPKKAKDLSAGSAKLLGEVWTTLLQTPLPRQIYRTVLVQLRKRILPVLANPLILADMLSDAFDFGGVVSLLALDGLFVLMTQHNLEYPKFYAKLYSLCKPHLLQAKHRGKFFTLLSLCLTSSHLPAGLVAAFAKRLSRLSLTATPPALVFMCTAVFNLLRRHPACRYLIHKPPQTVSTESSGLLVAPTEAPKPEIKDPFLADEDDPALSQATLSSLWEMQTLTNHYCPQVSRIAKELFAENSLKTKDLDIAATTEHTYLSLIETEFEWRKNQPTPLTFENTLTLFTAKTPDGIFSIA